MNQSFSTPFSLSGRSDHSGDTSSAFVEVFPSARDASCPANTRERFEHQRLRMHETYKSGGDKYRDMIRRVGMPAFQLRRTLCPRHILACDVDTRYSAVQWKMETCRYLDCNISFIAINT